MIFLLTENRYLHTSCGYIILVVLILLLSVNIVAVVYCVHEVGSRWTHVDRLL